MWGHQFFGRKCIQPALLLISFSALILLFNFLQSPESIWANHHKRVYPIGHSADVRWHSHSRMRNNWRMEIAATAEREKGMVPSKMGGAQSEEKGDNNALGNDDLMAATVQQKIQRNGPTNDNGPKTTVYPARMNMGPCPPRFGRIMVLVIVVESSYKTHYAVAQRSLECYLRTTNYTFRLVDLDHDERVNRHCKHDQLFFKKQCAVSIYLPDSDWTLVLDADAGVVNPNHCIEEWIDDRVDLIFYERFFNWEVASGNYLAKNTEFSRAFIMDWANMQYTQPKNFSGADNGALQLHILRTVIPEAKAEAKACQKIWQFSNNYERYMGYVTCVKVALGATRLWPGKLRILRRAHGWVRDWFLTTDSWSHKDFMLHGWKAQNLSQGWQSPFRQVPVPIQCTGGYAGWNWRNEMRVSVEEIRRQLAQVERSSGFGYPAAGRILPYLSEPDIGECYPDCDQWT